jgi:hypothetical protein
VDLTALMAALSGTKWPGNNVGIVPTDVLEADERRTAELALGNARGIIEQFGVKEGESFLQQVAMQAYSKELIVDLKSKHRLLFRPFPDLSVISDKASTTAQTQAANIDAIITRGDFADGDKQSKDLSALALRGIDFYDTFDQNRLKTIVTAGYGSFALYTLIYTIETYGTLAGSKRYQAPSSKRLDLVIAALAAGIAGLFMLEKTPWYCLYASFPLYFMRCLLQYWSHGVGGARRPAGQGEVLKVAASAAASLCILFYMAVCDLYCAVPDR